MRPAEKRLWFAGAALAILALATLWIASYVVADDKAKAALIGAASALTVAIFTFGGGFLTSWRTQTLAMRATVAAERRSAYSKFLAAAEKYEDALIAQTSAREQHSTTLTRLGDLSKGQALEGPEANMVDEQMKAAETELEDWDAAIISYNESVSNTFLALLDAKAGADLLASSATSEAITAYLLALGSDEARRREARSAFLEAARRELLVP